MNATSIISNTTSAFKGPIAMPKTALSAGASFTPLPTMVVTQTAAWTQSEKSLGKRHSFEVELQGH